MWQAKTHFLKPLEETNAVLRVGPVLGSHPSTSFSDGMEWAPNKHTLSRGRKEQINEALILVPTYLAPWPPILGYYISGSHLLLRALGMGPALRGPGYGSNLETSIVFTSCWLPPRPWHNLLPRLWFTDLYIHWVCNQNLTESILNTRGLQYIWIC